MVDYNIAQFLHINPHMRFNSASILNVIIMVHLYPCFSSTLNPNQNVIYVAQRQFPTLTYHNFTSVNSSYDSYQTFEPAPYELHPTFSSTNVGRQQCNPQLYNVQQQACHGQQPFNPELYPQHPYQSQQQSCHQQPPGPSLNNWQEQFNSHADNEQPQHANNPLSEETLKTYLQGCIDPAKFLSGESLETYLQEFSEPADYLRKLYKDHLERLELHRKDYFREFKNAVSKAAVEVVGYSSHSKAFGVEDVTNKNNKNDKNFTDYGDEIDNLENAILGEDCDYHSVRHTFINHLSIILQKYHSLQQSPGDRENSQTGKWSGEGDSVIIPSLDPSVKAVVDKYMKQQLDNIANLRSSPLNNGLNQLLGETQYSIKRLNNYITLIKKCYECLVKHYSKKYHKPLHHLRNALENEDTSPYGIRLYHGARYLQMCNDALKAMCYKVITNGFVYGRLRSTIKKCYRRDKDFQDVFEHSDIAEFLKSAMARRIRSKRGTCLSMQPPRIKRLRPERNPRKKIK